MNKILLVKPPFFTPWTPPLGIALLKSFLEQYGYSVRCFDYNTDSELWDMHHNYFTALQRMEDVSINDGYSKLWWVLNAHMLAYANGASPAECSLVLDTVIPLYGIKYDRSVIKALLPIVDKYFKRLEEITYHLAPENFKVVGTSTYTTSLASSLFILKKIKQKNSPIMTVMGGGIFADDLAPGSYNLETLLREYPFIDHVVLGEGERIFLTLLQGEVAKRVIGLTDIEQAPLDLAQSCLPDFSDLDLAPYYHLTIEGGRSCPFQCKFCSETVQWGKYRKKPVELFAEQLGELAQKYGNRTFFLADSLINTYITDLAQELLKRKTSILYDGYLRADKPVTDRSQVRLWSRSGLYRVRLGIESGSAHVLSLMNKRTTPETYSQVLKSLAGAGVRTTTYWVVGFPGETKENLEETLEFVREHHRYIYELEPHPYYYYPEGQVGSNLYKNHSLYPDDVTRIIKFKRWEVRDGEPTREETFARLRQFSKFAADLGLPNIYTMSERYQAEDRWQLLHPLVAEVYGRTPACRQAQTTSESTTVVAAEQKDPLGKEIGDTASVLCYQVVVKKKLDPTLLSASSSQLAKYNGIFQLQRGIQDRAHPSDALLVVCSCEGKCKDEINTLKRQTIEKLAAEMSLEPGRSMRLVAMIDDEQSFTQVILLVHRLIADGKSLVLLWEDLFRIYEQLSVGKEISLRPVKAYTEFVNELTSVPKVKLAWPGTLSSRVHESGARSARVLLDVNLSKRVLAGIESERDPTPGHVLASALIRSLARDQASATLDVDVTIDYRTIETGLSHTAGPLTRRARLQMSKDDGLLGLYEAWQVAKTSLCKTLEPSMPQQPPDRMAGQVLLNLEYLVDEPWLGGDEWIPQGFIVNENDLRGNCLLEIAPVPSADGIAVHLKYSDRPDVSEIVETLTTHLAQDVTATLDQCDHYRTAQRFWLTEFNDVASKSILEESKAEKHEAAGEEWAWISCGIQKSTLDSLQEKLQSDWPHILLAAYGVFLSRSRGVQDLTVVLSMDEKGAFPLRMRPSWSLSFNKFIRDFEQKVVQATEHQAYAFHFLTDPVWATAANCSRPAFDFGYVFRNSEQERDGNGLEKVLKRYPGVRKELGLVLQVVGNCPDIDVHLAYKQGVLEPQTVGEMGYSLTSILNTVAQKPDIPLGYIVLRTSPGSRRR